MRRDLEKQQKKHVARKEAAKVQAGKDEIRKSDMGYAKGGKAKKDKKWMQKVSASIKKRGTKGKCTPITKPGCTGRAKALAKTFKKIAAKRKKILMATRIKTQFKNNKQGWTSKLMTPRGVNTPYIGSYMNSKLGDVKVNNKSLETFYGDKIKP